MPPTVKDRDYKKKQKQRKKINYSLLTKRLKQLGSINNTSPNRSVHDLCTMSGHQKYIKIQMNSYREGPRSS